MKVLEKKPWGWVFDCKGCGSKLEASIEDIKWAYFGGSYCENGEKKHYAVCPLCGSDNILPDAKVVPHIEKKAKKSGSVSSDWD